VERDQINNDGAGTTLPSMPFYAVAETIPQHGMIGGAENKCGTDSNKSHQIDIEKDVQMLSEFHSSKKFHKSNHKTWLKEHPLAMEILSDLTQHLLIHKPDNPKDAIKQYFLN